MSRRIPIVPTKLAPPIIRSPILPRPRLIERLDLATRLKVTLLCAGPGYGKTTLLSTLANSRVPLVWYSLGHSDRDLSVFLSYLIQGIRRHHSGFGKTLLQQVSRKESAKPNPEQIAGQLVNDLDGIRDRELLIVLDDYHTVDTHQAIRGTLSHLLMHMPPRIHLVISSRRATRLSVLPRLRMLGEVNDIGERDLRFTPEEIHDLFAQTYGLRLDDRVLRALTTETEGWIIGLQLAAQSLRADRLMNADDLMMGLGANKRRLFEYLAEEVYKRQPVAIQRFLSESSVLSTLSAESCDAVLDRNDSASMLEQVERSNLFIAELRDGYWRYHYLFRNFLRQQLAYQPGRLPELHKRAASYFEGRKDNLEAIQHYLAAGDYTDAVRLVLVVGRSMIRASRFDTVTHWITQIPEELHLATPELLFLQAQVFEHQGHYDRSMEWAERAARGFASKGDGLGLAKVLCSKAYQLAWRGGRYKEADALYQKALEHLPPENRRERADLLRCVSLIHLPAGRPRDAKETYLQTLQMYEEMGDIEGVVATLINPGTWVYWLRGDFVEGLASLNRALALSNQLGSKHRQSECLGCMSINLRYLDRCDEAKKAAEEALAISREIGAVQLEAHNLAYLGMALSAGTTPDLQRAHRCFLESVELAEREGNERIRISALIGDMTALRKMGDREQIIATGDRLMGFAQASTDRWLIADAQLNVGAALIGLDDTRAVAMLQQALNGFTEFDDKWNLMCANFWLAVLLNASEPSRAQAHLATCLRIAQANRYDPWFVEERKAAIPLLEDAIRKGIETEYCSMLIDRIGQPKKDAFRSDRDNGRAERHSSPTDQLLRIFCFGNFRLYVGDRLIREDEWRRRKAKSLMEWLAVCREHCATRDQLVELLWGDLEPEAGQANLSRTLHVLRQVIGDRNSGGSFIFSRGGLVGLRPEALAEVDVDSYLRHIAAAERAERSGDQLQAEHHYEAAEALYKGELLADNPYQEWTIAKREQFRQMHMATLLKLATARMNARDWEGAAIRIKKVIDEDPTHEDAHALLMRCLVRLGRRREALAQYAACQRALRDELQVEPMAEIKNLYDLLSAGETI